MRQVKILNMKINAIQEAERKRSRKMKIFFLTLSFFAVLGLGAAYQGGFDFLFQKYQVRIKIINGEKEAQYLIFCRKRPLSK